MQVEIENIQYDYLPVRHWKVTQNVGYEFDGYIYTYVNTIVHTESESCIGFDIWLPIPVRTQAAGGLVEYKEFELH